MSALTLLRNRLLATMPATFTRRAEVDAEAVLEARGLACRPGPRAQYEPEILDAIDAALTGPFMLEIDYSGTQDAAPRSRAVQRYGVLFGMRGYLIARGVEGVGFRHFRLNRISRAVMPRGHSGGFIRIRNIGRWSGGLRPPPLRLSAPNGISEAPMSRKY